jgi:alpha-galactosidase/6-phospho-beta-glucosidase family protein
MSAPKITFIGAGSTVFVKNILGDVFQRPALKSAHIALMDIDATRLEESHIVVRKLMDSVGADGEISCHREQRTALDADFVVVAFQIGGYEPCTVTDFEVCKRMAWNKPLPIRSAGRNHARITHHSAPVAHLRRHDGGLPAGDHAELR